MFAKKIMFKQVISDIKKSFNLIKQYDKKYLPITILVSLVLGILPAASIRIMQIIINSLQYGEKGIKFYIFLTFSYISIGGLSALLNSCYGYYKTKFKYNFDKSIRLKMQKKATEVSLKKYENSETYNIINRAQNQSGDMIVSFIDSFVLIIQLIVSILTTTTILMAFHMELIIVVIVFPIIRYFVSIIFIKKQYKLEIEITKDERKLWYMDYLFMMGLAYKEIKVYGINGYLTKRYSHIKNAVINKRLKIIKKSTVANLILSLLDHVAGGLVFLYYIIAGIKDIIMIGDVVTYTRCIFEIKNYIESILNSFSNIAQSALYVDFLFQFLEMKSSDCGLIQKKCCLLQIETIEMKNVSYKYDRNYVLKNISLKVWKDQTLVIVGMNGSGKSTLFKILLGLYEDYEGEVLINGIDIKKIDLASYYRHVSCMFQDYMKYEFTLQDNIGFGNVKDINNLKKLEQIRSIINLDSQIFKKAGLQTCLGNWFGGKQVSEGEWQKIAIGRMLFNAADAFFLDEPDSSLDNISEEILVKQIKRQLKNKIGFWITHNMKNVPNIADTIMVLDKGVMTEFGTHKELMRNGGIYSKLYNSKFD